MQLLVFMVCHSYFVQMSIMIASSFTILPLLVLSDSVKNNKKHVVIKNIPNERILSKVDSQIQGKKKMHDCIYEQMGKELSSTLLSIFSNKKNAYPTTLKSDHRLCWCHLSPITMVLTGPPVDVTPRSPLLNLITMVKLYFNLTYYHNHN